MLIFANGEYRNSAELRYFGRPVNIEDSTAGQYNVVYLEEEAVAAPRNTKIFSSARFVNIVDTRPDADLEPSVLEMFDSS